MKLNLKFQEFCRNLSGSNSLNYSCSAKIYTGDWSDDKEPQELLKTIMGVDFSISNLQKNTSDQMLDVIRQSFAYSGDTGTYPSELYFLSPKFECDLAEILSELKGLAIEKSNIYSFYILDGHPFYPVFWEFAFLIESNNKAYIVIGSSSD